MAAGYVHSLRQEPAHCSLNAELLFRRPDTQAHDGCVAQDVVAARAAFQECTSADPSLAKAWVSWAQVCLQAAHKPFASTPRCQTLTCLLSLPDGEAHHRRGGEGPNRTLSDGAAEGARSQPRAPEDLPGLRLKHKEADDVALLRVQGAAS